MSYFNQRMLYGIALPSEKEKEIKPFIADMYGINEPEEIKEPIPPKIYPKKEDNKPESGDIISKEVESKECEEFVESLMRLKDKSNKKVFERVSIVIKHLLISKIKESFELKADLVKRAAIELYEDLSFESGVEDKSGSSLKVAIDLVEKVISEI